MSRRFVLTVVKVSYSPASPWMVRVPSRLQRIEGATKKFFEREGVAKAYVERLARQMGNYQAQALGMSDKQKMEAAECFELLENEKVSLLEAVQHYLDYRKEADKSVPVLELFESFLKAKTQDDASPKYLADLRSKLGRFATAFQKTLACDLTTSVLELWLRKLKVGPVSRESYRRNISVMLEFGRRQGVIRVNPAADIKFSRRPQGEVTILTSEEIRRLLGACNPELVPYLAICAFAGLRPTEAANLEWQDIHLDSGQIEVKARHSKTRRYRLVPIQPNLGAWLTRYQKESGPIGFSRRQFREAYEKAGFEKWPNDVLRHSYGTYRLPLLKSADALALEMGNSAEVIFRHYRRPMDEATAADFFKILPPSII